MFPFLVLSSLFGIFYQSIFLSNLFVLFCFSPVALPVNLAITQCIFVYCSQMKMITLTTSMIMLGPWHTLTSSTAYSPPFVLPCILITYFKFIVSHVDYISNASCLFVNFHVFLWRSFFFCLKNFLYYFFYCLSTNTFS